MSNSISVRIKCSGMKHPVRLTLCTETSPNGEKIATHSICTDPIVPLDLLPFNYRLPISPPVTLNTCFHNTLHCHAHHFIINHIANSSIKILTFKFQAHNRKKYVSFWGAIDRGLQLCKCLFTRRFITISAILQKVHNYFSYSPEGSQPCRLFTRMFVDSWWPWKAHRGCGSPSATQGISSCSPSVYVIR